MSIRLNKAARELNIGLQTAVDFLEQRKDLGEVKADPAFKLNDKQYKALANEFKDGHAINIRPAGNTQNRAETTKKEYKYIKTEGRVSIGKTLSPDKYESVLKIIGKGTLHPRFGKYVHITGLTNSELVFANVSRDVYTIKTSGESRPGLELEKTDAPANVDDYTFSDLMSNSLVSDDHWVGIIKGSIENHDCPETVTCPACKGDGICKNCNGEGSVKCPDCDGTGRCSHCNASGLETCPDCDGDGYIECPHCDGRGYFVCPDCDGTGIYSHNGRDVECRRCNGTGKLTCQRCHGRGRITCNNCDGDGMITCRKCGGTKRCSVCHGSGKVICDECHGDGKCPMCHGKKVVVCPRCNGTGHFQTYTGYVITSFSSQGNYCSMPDFADAVAKEKIEKILSVSLKQERDQEEYVLGNLQDVESKMDAKNFLKLKEWLKSLPKDSTTNRLFLDEETKVYSTPLTKVLYTVGKKTYSFYLIGPDRIIAIDTDDMPSRLNFLKHIL